MPWSNVRTLFTLRLNSASPEKEITHKRQTPMVKAKLERSMIQSAIPLPNVPTLPIECKTLASQGVRTKTEKCDCEVSYGRPWLGMAVLLGHNKRGGRPSQGTQSQARHKHGEHPHGNHVTLSTRRRHTSRTRRPI